MVYYYLITAAVFFLVVTIFAVQNLSPITISFLLWELPSVPQVMVILLSFLSGLLVTFLYGTTRQIKLSKQLNELKDYARLLEKELSKLKPELQHPKEDQTKKN